MKGGLKFIGLCVVVILLSLGSESVICFAQELSNKLEERLKEKDWKGVYSILNTLPDKNAKDQYRKERLSEAARFYMGFMEHYDMCQLTDNLPSKLRETLTCYKNVMNYRQHAPKSLPFSQTFVDDINGKSRFVQERMALITAAIQEEETQNRTARQAQLIKTRERLEAEEKQHKEEIIARDSERIEEQRAREGEESRGREKRQLERRAKDIFIKAQQAAFDDPKYKAVALACSICECIDNNRRCEAAILEEKRYSTRYGVLNVGKIEGYKSQIMLGDNTIATNRVEYKNLTGKSFSPSQCRSLELPCEGFLSSLRIRLIKASISSEDIAIQKLIFHTYMGEN
jgi:hypothetical protein